MTPSLDKSRAEELRGLASRIEGLTGHCRLHDGRIEFALHGKTGRMYLDLNKGGYVARSDCPHYTASLDAAMSLVPEGWNVGVFVRHDWPKHHAQVWHPQRNASTRQGDAATPALALCAAALRALAESEQ